MVLTVAVTKGWRLTQLDISNVFLHGNLEERLVNSQPIGFYDNDKPHHMCLLKNALYGSKQAPTMWFKHLKEFLVSSEFIQGWVDPSLFIISNSAYKVYLFVYVDDMAVTGSNDEYGKRLSINLVVNLQFKD